MTEINELAKRIHEISTSKGFKEPSLANLPEKLMLSVSELSEALEEHRSNKPLIYQEDGKPEGVLVEIGDSIIRNLHMMHSLIEKHDEDNPEYPLRFSVSDVLNLKVDFNADRPFKHGRHY